MPIEELAEKCFMSLSSLCHFFKEDFGISVKKYIIQKRMIGAHQAILDGGSSKDISILFGFNDYSTFYRSYQKYYGYPPSETRKRNENGIKTEKKH